MVGFGWVGLVDVFENVQKTGGVPEIFVGRVTGRDVEATTTDVGRAASGDPEQWLPAGIVTPARTGVRAGGTA